MYFKETRLGAMLTEGGFAMADSWSSAGRDAHIVWSHTSLDVTMKLFLRCDYI